MNVSVVDLSANQKKLQVEIPAERVQEEIEGKYRDLAKKVRIKGFRPGKVPRSIIKSYYGQSIENDVSSQFIRETFSEALRRTDLKPLVEADVSESHFADNGSFTYIAVVDVCPPFEVEAYKGLAIRRPEIHIDEAQEKAEMDRLLQQHSQLRTIEEERPVQEGDVVLVDLTPLVDGSVFEKGKTDDYMLEVGKKSIHPDFDGHLAGHRVGDRFSFDVDYPEDAPTREIAGKRVTFDVTVKGLKEKIVPELSDEFARTVGSFETLDELKKSIRDQLLKREEQKVSGEVRRQIVDQLLSKVQIELSSKVIEREVDRLIEGLQHQFESQGLKIDAARFNSPEIRAEYWPQADKSLRRRLILQQIARLENIELSEDESDEIYREVARLFRIDVQTLKTEYTDSIVVEQAMERKLEDKAFQFLEDEAIIQSEDVSPEETDTDKE